MEFNSSNFKYLAVELLNSIRDSCRSKNTSPGDVFHQLKLLFFQECLFLTSQMKIKQFFFEREIFTQIPGQYPDHFRIEGSAIPLPITCSIRFLLYKIYYC